MKREVTILGAGLVGSLLAIILKKKGHAVSIFERRPDMRSATIAAGRSINLAMSERGWKALKLAGLESDIASLAIPMYGRFLHQPDGSSAFQQYGKNKEAIYSVSRGELNKKLMTLAEKEGVKINFEKRCTHVDVASNTLHFEDAQNVKADLLFGADGAFSALRNSYSYLERVSMANDYLEHGYKELSIPPLSGKAQMDENALHIWPRKNFMLIALPNTDGNFTCTLFLPFSGGENSFEALNTEADVQAFFEKNFPDAVPLMPTLIQDFFENPTASLITTHMAPWHFEDKSMLIGDAAHAIVPFYGQGMNAGFEDCTVLESLMDEGNNDWHSIFQSFYQKRKPDGDAVAKLALINFIEMRDKVADPQFLERKKVEKELGRLYPDQFVSVYEMVSFTHTPYHAALELIDAQDALWKKIKNAGNFEENMAQNNGFKKQLDDWMNDYAAEAAKVKTA